jgi:TolB-like protein
VLDFGLAKLVLQQPPSESAATITQATNLTMQGIPVGTLTYMSPEQARGEELDARTDLFSFGAVLYEMATGRPAFSGNSTAMVFDSILRQQPLSVARLNPAAAPQLEEIIAKALEKERKLRYQSAAEMRADLERLRRDSATSALLAAAPPVAPAKLPGWRAILALAAVMVVIAGVLAWWKWGRGSSQPRNGPTTLAVLPLQNAGTDSSADFLRLAVADEVVTTLSYMPTLAIRPFTMTRKYVQSDVDPQKAGRELRVSDVLTGHYLQEGNTLRVTLELIDVDSNRVIWRDRVSGSPKDMIALQSEIASRVQQGIIAVLGGRERGEARTHPQNPEAYELFLRAAALSRDQAPNREAMGLLERAVQLDPNYAPAWNALGHRLYSYGTYGDGGPDAIRRCKQAFQRALALDPNLIDAAASLVNRLVEEGDLTTAYDRALDLVRKRPESPEAHMTLGYVFRYAGLLEQSSQQCDIARGYDPRNPSVANCALVHMQNGQYDRAAEILLHIDPESEWSRSTMLDVELRRGNDEKVAKLSRELPPEIGGGLLDKCVERRPRAEIEAVFARATATLDPSGDPEPFYWIAAYATYCGMQEKALSMLRHAIAHNYCAYPALDRDVAFAPLRRNPEFAAVRAAGMECQKKFTHHMAQQRQ